MNDDQFDDLKQYIAATISQATTDLVTKSDLAVMQTHVDSRLNEIQESIAESISVGNDSVDEHINAHNRRITKLEQLTAQKA